MATIMDFNDINFEELEFATADEEGPLQAAYGPIEEYAPDDYVASYEQIAHTVSGPVGFYTSGSDKMMHAAQTMSYGKRAAFYSKMPNELRNIFGVESNLVNEYMEMFTHIPRYWIRNPKLLIATVELGKHIDKELTPKILNSVAASQNVLPADLYRYYKLFKDSNLLQ